MTRKAKSAWWTGIVLYGLSLGLLLAALQFSKYRLLTLANAEQWYIALVATMFAGVGIWAGMQWSGRKVAGSHLPVDPTPPNTEWVERLGITPRELEVLKQMALGMSNQEIAAKLFVSLNTVKTHSSNLFAKLDVQRRTQAIQRAKELGILS